MATAAEDSHRTDHAALEGLSKLSIKEQEGKKKELDLAKGE